MSDFETAVKRTIENEGGDAYTETKDDRGGATKYGISLNKLLIPIYLKNSERNKSISTCAECLFTLKPTKNTIRELTETQAKTLYRIYFWDANRYGEIENQYIANKVFDMAVLMGAPKSNKILQDVFNYAGFISVKSDGIIGPKTISLINQVDYETGSIFVDDNDIEDNFKLLLTRYFISICNKDKKQSKFLLGWLNRVML